MKQYIFIYCEGTDAKVIAVEKTKDKLKILKAASLEIIQPSVDIDQDIRGLKIEADDDLSLVGLNTSEHNTVKKPSYSSLTFMNAALDGLKLNKTQFVSVITEPSAYYHEVEGTPRTTSSKVTMQIAEELQRQRNIAVDKDNIEYVPLADQSYLSVFVSGEIECVKLINSLANYNGRKFYKIPAIKSAEISLAYYIIKKEKFFPDDSSLIVYIGKDYSKLIFLKGRKLKHIGSTLDIGKSNLHTYDVYFSKILLEMENGGISSLDNIIVCGEDDSENLLLSFYGTFPEANVTKVDFKDVDVTELPTDTKNILSSFCVPIAAAQDFFADLSGEHKGINLLPKYVIEQQKFLQFGWHGFAILPLLFVAAFFFTQKTLENNSTIKSLNSDIIKYQKLYDKNQSIINQITSLEGKINNFGRTQAILDSVSIGTLAWTRAANNISSFIKKKKNLWLTSVALSSENKVKLEGYSLNKYVVTDLAYSLRSAELKSVFFETLREKNSYKFVLSFDIANYNKAGK
ncbi:MAG TPA: hypothetical protein ENI57_08635 [Ignavibacteria bacterium]|nr:hypothetical protein [Ignavibacteria bacterium]